MLPATAFVEGGSHVPLRRRVYQQPSGDRGQREGHRATGLMLLVLHPASLYMVIQGYQAGRMLCRMAAQDWSERLAMHMGQAPRGARTIAQRRGPPCGSVPSVTTWNPCRA
jgi:hypothetical protein